LPLARSRGEAGHAHPHLARSEDASWQPSAAEGTDVPSAWRDVTVHFDALANVELYERARRRVFGSVVLAPYYDRLFRWWPEETSYLRWLATAPAEEIASRARSAGVRRRSAEAA
jgi:hypothetical protein